MWEAIKSFFAKLFSDSTPETPSPQPSSKTILKGFDTSHWNPVVDWKKLRAAKESGEIDFAYTKLTEGLTNLDPKAKEIVQGCNDMGLPIGVYCVIQTGDDMQAQVDWFKKCLASIGPVQCRHAIDFEGHVNAAFSVGTNRAACLHAVDLFQSTFNQKPILYHNLSNEKDFAFTDEEQSKFLSWLAAYRDTKPTPTTLKRVFIWQNSDKGDVPGIGSCDTDICYGSISELTGEQVKTPVPTVETTVQAKAINPAYVEAKRYAGQGESDSKFVAFMSGFWAKLGIHYKTIIGSSFAWCGLFIFVMNTQVGLKAISGAAGARNWAKYGVEIDWKTNGIPRGAVMHLNHAGNCSSGSNNHVTFADGDCSASDLKKPGATVPGFGGNQSNQVKRSNYSVKEVCEVRWPSEIPKPGPVLKSDACSGVANPSESTK